MEKQGAEYRAPGKLVLLGEYAVLGGTPALVVALDRHAYCRRVDGGDAQRGHELGVALRVDAGIHGSLSWPADRDVERLPLVRGLLARLTDPPPGEYHLDSDALYGDTLYGDTLYGDTLHGNTPVGRRKLGLGSSAASTVALAAALRGDGVLDDDARRAIYRLVQTVHREVQGLGSGVDVAAASLGGALAYRWVEDQAKAPPDGLETADGVGHAEVLPRSSHPIRAVWSGDSASTASLARLVAAWGKRDPAGLQRRMADLSMAAQLGIDAWRGGDREALVAAAEAGRHAIDALGRDAGIALLTETHVALHDLAARHSAGVKPTGAGGGDLAWLYAEDPDAEVAAAKALVEAGHLVLELGIANGVERVG